MRLLMIGLAALAATATPAWAAPETWLLSVDRWGNAEHGTLTLEASGSVLTGRLDDWIVSGRRNGDAITFIAPTATAIPAGSRASCMTAS